MGDVAIALVKTSASEHDIVQRYYELRQRHVPGTRWPARTKKAQEYALRYLDWCRKNGVDPFLFMEARFGAFGKKADGRYPALVSMCSPKALERWRAWQEGKSLEEHRASKVRRVRRTADEKRVIKLLTAPTQLQENLRRTHLQTKRLELCQIDADLIGGYDPRSKHCPTCPNKHGCLLSLNRAEGFDVGALRVRLFDRLPPRVVEAARVVLAR